MSSISFRQKVKSEMTLLEILSIKDNYRGNGRKRVPFNWNKLLQICARVLYLVLAAAVFHWVYEFVKIIIFPVECRHKHFRRILTLSRGFHVAYLSVSGGIIISSEVYKSESNFPYGRPITSSYQIPSREDVSPYANIQFMGIQTISRLLSGLF